MSRCNRFALRRFVWTPSTIALIVVAAFGCGTHVPKPANLAPGTPHISWIIMYGDRDNADREFACQSHPRNDCVIPPSRPDAQVFTDVHLYYHGAGGETKYAGAFEIGYLQGSSPSRQFKTDLTVKKNESLTNQSVIGVVTGTPGTHHVSFDITATVTETRKTQPIREQVAVLVK